jgi:hypothetical protein
MWRCEEEIKLKINPSNVVDVLVTYYSRLSKDLSNDEILEIEEKKEEEPGIKIDPTVLL